MFKLMQETLQNARIKEVTFNTKRLQAGIRHSCVDSNIETNFSIFYVMRIGLSTFKNNYVTYIN